MNVPNDTLVISKRKKGGSTITGYKKTEIKKQFKKCLSDKNIELAIRWGIELHCSGNINDIFNILILFAASNIKSHLVFYMIDKYLRKIEIVEEQLKKKIETRNNQEVRNLLVDIIYIICSAERSIIPNIKIFDINNYTIIAKDLEYIRSLKFPNDRKETVLALNEVITYLIKFKTHREYKFHGLLFWYFWLEKVELQYKKQKLIFENNERECAKNILPTNFRWFFWNLILNQAERENNNIFVIIKAMYNCYVFKQNKTTVFKRKDLIIKALYLLFHKKIKPVIKSFSKRLQVCCSSNVFYKEIADYLYANEEVFEKPKKEKPMELYGEIIDVNQEEEEETNPEAEKMKIIENIMKVKKKGEKKYQEDVNMEYLFNFDAVRKK